MDPSINWIHLNGYCILRFNLYKRSFWRCYSLCFYISMFYLIVSSHKKRKNSLEGRLDRVLFVAELEFPKILVPRLPQNTSNVNTECAGCSKNSVLYMTSSLLEHWYIIFLFWYQCFNWLCMAEIVHYMVALLPEQLRTSRITIKK